MYAHRSGVSISAELRQIRFYIHKPLPRTLCQCPSAMGKPRTLAGYNIKAWPEKGRCGRAALAVVWGSYENRVQTPSPLGLLNIRRCLRKV